MSWVYNGIDLEDSFNDLLKAQEFLGKEEARLRALHETFDLYTMERDYITKVLKMTIERKETLNDIAANIIKIVTFDDPFDIRNL